MGGNYVFKKKQLSITSPDCMRVRHPISLLRRKNIIQRSTLNPYQKIEKQVQSQLFYCCHWGFPPELRWKSRRRARMKKEAVDALVTLIESGFGEE